MIYFDFFPAIGYKFNASDEWSFNYSYILYICKYNNYKYIYVIYKYIYVYIYINNAYVIVKIKG